MEIVDWRMRLLVTALKLEFPPRPQSKDCATHPSAQVLRRARRALREAALEARLLQLLLLLLLAAARGLRLAARLRPDNARRRKSTGHAVDAGTCAANHTLVARLDGPFRRHCVGVQVQMFPVCVRYGSRVELLQWKWSNAIRVSARAY